HVSSYYLDQKHGPELAVGNIRQCRRQRPCAFSGLVLHRWPSIQVWDFDQPHGARVTFHGIFGWTRRRGSALRVVY
ncbi:unnamed protein product, partial [Heterosigma akashiwo]